jgi:hypothetical protein
MGTQKTKTTFLSDEIKENFNEWLKSWDFKINSVDNRDNLEIAVNQCKDIINLSSKICNDIERKYIKSALNGKLEGSNDYNEAYVKAIEKAEGLETHKELKKINNLAFSLMYYIENLNEKKNTKIKIMETKQKLK